ncbi:MAG: coenzyme A pyrophosphatase, partial [Flavobacteriales bacterium]
IDKKPAFILNHEVANTIEILVSDLLNENNITTVNLTTSYMKNIDVPCFKIDDHIIWGATGMMLSEIKELLL